VASVFSPLMEMAAAQSVGLAAAPAVQPAAGREEIARIIRDWAQIGGTNWYRNSGEADINAEELADRILAVLAHPPAQGSESGGERPAYRVTWVDDAKNPNDRRLYVDGSQWAKAYGWDKASLDARCVILEAALSQPGPASEGEAR
jgi:hypothetical protein